MCNASVSSQAPAGHSALHLMYAAKGDREWIWRSSWSPTLVIFGKAQLEGLLAWEAISTPHLPAKVKPRAPAVRLDGTLPSGILRHCVSIISSCPTDKHVMAWKRQGEMGEVCCRQEPRSPSEQGQEEPSVCGELEDQEKSGGGKQPAPALVAARPVHGKAATSRPACHTATCVPPASLAWHGRRDGSERGAQGWAKSRG